MALIAAYDIGDELRIGNHVVTAAEIAAGANATDRVPFTDVTGQALDPDEATVSIHKPDGTSVGYGWPAFDPLVGQLVHQGTGRFYVDVILDQPGRWVWKESGTGAAQVSTGDHEFWVKGSMF